MPAKGERAAALARGEKTYHAMPCREGHGTMRFVANGHCVECNRLAYLAVASVAQKKWRAGNPERAREIGRRSEARRRRNAEFESFMASTTKEQKGAL